MEKNESYTVEFLPDAFSDMTEIISSFVMLGSRQGAKRINGKFIKAAEQLSIFPYSGIAVPDKKLAGSGFRMIVVEIYLLFYKVFDDEKKVTVYRVMNGKRNYPALMRSLYENNE